MCKRIYLEHSATFLTSGYLFIFTKVVAVTGRALAGGLRALKTSPSSQSFLRTWSSSKVKKLCKLQRESLESEGAADKFWRWKVKVEKCQALKNWLKARWQKKILTRSTSFLLITSVPALRTFITSSQSSSALSNIIRNVNHQSIYRFLPVVINKLYDDKVQLFLSPCIPPITSSLWKYDRKKYGLKYVSSHILFIIFIKTSQ